ncbi:histidine kinase [Terrimonas rubra]|uniref:histidine kinase n=1 Tax=Terrimonas rubra TaxID=1035890 RepID=A0ABW6A408_9BACT
MTWLFCMLLPLYAISQPVNPVYIEKKLAAAREQYQQFDYTDAQKTLDELYTQSVKSNNYYGAAMALIKKNLYGIERGDYTRSEPDWQAIDNLHMTDKTEQTQVKVELLNLRARYEQKQKNNSKQAEQFLDEAIKMASHLPANAYVLGESYYLYGQIKSKNSQFIEANKYLLAAIKIFEANNDPASIGLVWGDLAHASFLIGEKERAIAYAYQSIDALKKNRDYESLSIQLSNLGRMYQLDNKPDSAVKYFLASAEYLNRSTRKETKFISKVDLALAYHAQKNRPEAFRYMEEAVQIGREISQPKLHRYIRMCAMLAGYAGNEKLMDQYYEESYRLASKDNDREALRDWHGSLNFYYANIKKDTARAFPYLEKFHAYKDSLVNERSKKDFNTLEVQYQTEKKQAEIERLAIEQRLQSLELEKKNALIKGNLIEAAQKEKEIQLLTQEKLINNLKIEQQAKSLSLAGSELKNLQQQQKIAEQESLLKEEKIRNEQLKRNLIIAMLIAAVIGFVFILNRVLLKKKIEQKNLLLHERNRISTELHDEVGSTLTAINLLSHSAIHQLNTDNGDASKKQVEKIKENTQSVMENISDIVWSMNPENDSFQQVIVRMKEFTGNILEPQNITYHFHIDDNLNTIKLSPEKRRDLYLVFKEAVNNMAKYSQATQAVIRLTRSGKNIVLTITDNGTGFDPTLVKKGNGLNNMHSRTERNHGYFELQSGESGTTVTVHYPYA